MPPKSINMLTSVQTAEVSLVKRGANNKRVALTKSENPMTFQELLKSVLATAAEGEEKLIKTLKAANAGEDTIEAAVASFRLQNGFKDKLSKEVTVEVARAAGFIKAEGDDEEEENPFKAKKKKKAEGEEEKEEDEEMPPKKKTAKSHLPADMPAEMQKIFKSQEDEISELRKSNDKTVAILSKERSERIRKEYITKCATDFSHVPGLNADEMGVMLQKAYDVSKEDGEQLEKSWVAVNEAIRKSTLLTNQGAVNTNDGASGAWAKMQSMAKELASKTEGLNEGAAMDAVMKTEEGAALYKEYLSENPAQSGRR